MNLQELQKAITPVYQIKCYICGTSQEHADETRLVSLCERLGWTAHEGTALCPDHEYISVHEAMAMRADMEWGARV